MMRRTKLNKKRNVWKGIAIITLIIIGLFISLILFVVFESANEEVISKISESIVWVNYEYGEKSSEGLYNEGKSSGSGILAFEDEKIYQIFSNRHVVDCSYQKEEPCWDKQWEKIQVRTQDGLIHEVKKVSYSPHNIDLVLLTIDKKPTDTYKIADFKEDDLYESEVVIAVGYPEFVDQTVEFSVSQGEVTGFRQLLMPDGYSVEAIDSNAYTNFGSSGGGLFDIDGNLIGINTWGSSQYETNSIKLSSLNNLKEEFFFCEEESSFVKQDNKCYKKCNENQIRSVLDGGCHNKCDGFYCLSEIFNADDPRCDNGLILGQDNLCHPPCGSSELYCVSINSVCYKNECSGCQSPNTIMYEDGYCYVGEYVPKEKPKEKKVCKEEYLDESECSGEYDLQRKYQYSDCSSSWVYERCPYGCQNGKCESCHDTDGGDYYTKGYVTYDIYGKRFDECVTDSILNGYLWEYSCRNSEFDAELYECPNGCSDGKCN